MAMNVNQRGGGQKGPVPLSFLFAISLERSENSATFADASASSGYHLIGRNLCNLPFMPLSAWPRWSG